MKAALVKSEGARTSRKKPPTKRTRGRPANNASVGPDLILRVARQTFARRGFEATSVREIARDCGVDPALIAHHFGSKGSLWTAVVQQIAEQALPLIEATAALRTLPIGATARVERAVALLVDQVFAQPDIGMFFSTAATEEGECSDKLIEELVRPYHDVLVPLLMDGENAGEVSVSNANLSFFMLVNAISKTVSYGHVLAAFSSLVEHRKKYKRAVLVTALKMLG
ncbi:MULTISPECIES: helix-turn-helix domain-containing protein [unclassified Caballeronia]|uniref:TetR/AcrR family transcriptional regulator n=1 Tax=unclassified Caballeronia TaxID=2646786 RepID=UPI00285F6743|nr:MULTISPECIES: helix-turn-helix domain-containing protein [unclassified Caballeronia]MDR5777566.1 helix-turn-helix domain containing protein [Caballeronia sp. LZ002]MDR5852989.1 helix-turn-helix domain containing protein [Caballeronia sp. LZ003]